MAKRKLPTFVITITFPKIMVWIAGLWLFILAILQACQVPNVNTTLFMHNNNGDSGAIILISAFLFCVVATFVRHRIGKLIAGVIYMAMALVGIAGALVTSFTEVSTWVIFVGELLVIIGSLIWLLEGLKVINKPDKKTTNTNSTNE